MIFSIAAPMLSRCRPSRTLLAVGLATCLVPALRAQEPTETEDPAAADTGEAVEDAEAGEVTETVQPEDGESNPAGESSGKNEVRRQQILDEINSLVDQLDQPAEEETGDPSSVGEGEADDAIAESGETAADRRTPDPDKATEEKTAEEAPRTGGKTWTGVDPLEKAAFFHQQGDYQLAERTYISVLESNADHEDKIEALTELAEVYRDRGTLARAVDTLETCLRKYPEIAERPETLFRLGQMYREMQLFDESIAMFYRVLNAIVVTGEQNLEKYLRLARLAQFEIARAHYVSGEYDRAYLLFDRIDLLELNPVDRETVLYYMALTALKSGKNKDGLRLVQRFVQKYPKSEYIPEMLYLEAEVLYRLGRVHAAVDSLMRLLETVGIPEEDQSRQWTYWRQQAGNRLANKLYEDGDYLVALRVYQGMVGLDDSTNWQLPIIYQIGLCFEKLGMLDRARESFAYVIQEVQERGEGALPEYLVRLAETASWRQDLLSWRGEINTDLRELVYEEPTSQGGSGVNRGGSGNGAEEETNEP